VIAFDQTKPLLKAFASAGVDTKKLYFVAGLSITPEILRKLVEGLR